MFSYMYCKFMNICEVASSWHNPCSLWSLWTINNCALSVYIILSLGNSKKTNFEFSSCVVQKVTVCFPFVPSYTAFRRGRTNFVAIWNCNWKSIDADVTNLWVWFKPLKKSWSKSSVCCMSGRKCYLHRNWHLLPTCCLINTGKRWFEQVPRSKHMYTPWIPVQTQLKQKEWTKGRSD